MPDLGDVTFIAGGIAGVIVFILLITLLRMVVRVCDPDQILVVTGTKTTVQGRDYGFRIQDGGWTFVIPYLQSVQALDLNIIPINVRVEGVNSANGITVGADATACVCVDDADQTLLYAAVERLMGKSRDEIQEQIRQTMVGNFRGALNKTTPLEAIGMVDSADGEISPNTDIVESEGERAQFRSALLSDSNHDLATFGMRVVSVSMQKIWDGSNYIANLANKTLSVKQKEVDIEEARLRARAAQAESDSNRRASIAINSADESILAASQELELARRRCEAGIEQMRLEADGAIAKADSEGGRLIQEATGKLQALRNVSTVTLEAQSKLRAAEILARAQSEATDIVQKAMNDLLRQKVELVSQSGDYGRIALFMQQRLAMLFEAFEKHAEGLDVDHLLVMDDERGVNGVVNRGPEALVDFLRHLDRGFGINVRDMLTVADKANGPEAAQ